MRLIRFWYLSRVKTKRVDTASAHREIDRYKVCPFVHMCVSARRVREREIAIQKGNRNVNEYDKVNTRYDSNNSIDM